MSSYPPPPGHGAPYPPPGAYPPPGGLDSTDRSMAVLAHLTTLIGALVSGGWLVVLGPLVMWVIFKDSRPFVRQAAAGAFNFAIWLNVAMIVAWVLAITVVGLVVAIPLFLASGIVAIIFPILGAVAADRGERYSYPLTPALLR